jgi:hypothetical protein
VVVTIVAVDCAVCLSMLRTWQDHNSLDERLRRMSEILRSDRMSGGVDATEVGWSMPKQPAANNEEDSRQNK